MPPQLRHAAGEQVEVLPRQAPDAERPGAADGRGARGAIEQRHLAEELAGPEARDHRVIDDDLGLSVEDAVDAVAEVALLEDLLARFEVLAHEQRLAAEAELHQLRREEEVERPGG